MKAALVIFIVMISLLGSVFSTRLIKTPGELTAFSKACPFEINMEKMPVMVVRVIDNSYLPKSFSHRCIFNQMKSDKEIVVINRENEPQILNELVHQSKIPADENSIQPIGEILAPSHLYVINEKDGWVEVSLSEIKSGIYTFKEEFEFNPQLEIARQNIDSIFKFILFAGIFLLQLIALTFIFKPLFQWIRRREEMAEINHVFKLAQKNFQLNNIYDASRLLVKCAESKVDCHGKTKAIELLDGLAKNMRSTT
jgi:hypothetical protein